MNDVNYRGFLTLIIGVALLFSLSACHYHEDSHSYDDYYYYDPDVVVNSVIKIDASVLHPARIIVELENIGYGHAYDIDGYLDIFLDRSMLESANFYVSFLGEGQVKFVEIPLYSVYTHDEYDRYSLDYGWYDENDRYY